MLMTKKSRFGSFVTSSGGEENPTPEQGVPTPAALMPEPGPAAPLIPQAPAREERRAFSTRVRPSQKAALDVFVMDLKRAGWPISQEAVLEELLRLLQEDEYTRATITQRLTRL
ncbi:hypothetical protein [Deinococcus sedimenti]|nr:hypothetical protein [Deinococcus sedimenti]